MCEAVSKIEDEIFRSFFIPDSSFPTELQQVFAEDMNCVDKESWLVQIAMTVWYCFQLDIPKEILKIAKLFSKGEVHDQQALRLLQLYAQRKLD